MESKTQERSAAVLWAIKHAHSDLTPIEERLESRIERRIQERLVLARQEG